MGLKGDLDEAKAVWSVAPWWMKAWLVLSVFLSVSSVASLSELIIKWKGFILDAIEFYRQWVSIPFSRLFESLNINISSSNTDFLILGLLFATSALREMWASTDNSDRSDVIGSIVGTFFAIPGVVVFIYNSNGVDASPSVFAVAGLIILYIALPFVLGLRNKVLYYTPVVIAVVLVLILGAVNSGLRA